MHIRYFTIAGGNQTALIEDCDPSSRLDLARSLLATVEQVGFTESGDTPTLIMMGGELCINALLAFASIQTLETGTIRIDTQLVTYSKTKNAATIIIPLPYTRIDTTILFDTIGYLITDNTEPIAKTFFQEQAIQHHLPAFGVIQRQPDSSIAPHVYVRDTNSLITETSCGSGSVAFSIVTGITPVIQPTQQTIAIHEHTVGMYTISAEVFEYYPSVLVY